MSSLQHRRAQYTQARHRQPLVIALVLSCCAATGLAQQAAAVSVLDDSSSGLTLRCSINDYRWAPVRINGDTYSLLTVDGEPRLAAAGSPALPHVTRSVVVPAGKQLRVSVDEARSTYREITNVDIAPSRGAILRTVDPRTVPYMFELSVYANDAFFPGKLADLGDPYYLREQRGVVVDLFPFQYNPVSRTLRVYTSLTVSIEFEDLGGISAFDDAGTQARKPSRAFENLYAAHFINYTPDRYPDLNEQGELLIICHDAWIDNVMPLAAHKESIGIPTTVVGVSTIGNNASSIGNYIQNAYDNGNLAFVLLVGDAVHVAPPMSGSDPTDPVYAKVAGLDNYPDILVGRFSAEDADDVDTQVERTISYELAPATQEDWFWRGVGIASSEGAGQGDEGQADYVHMGEIRQWLLDGGYTEVDEIYDPAASDAMVAAAVNAGRGIINYTGHGTATAWSTTGFNIFDVNALTNTNMLPFIVSVACVNGQFDDRTCFAETWLRATHDGEPSGAIAMYASSIDQYWAPPMEAQDELNQLYLAGAYEHYGTLCYAGSCAMIDAYGADGIRMFNTWHIFGDPSLQVVGTAQPPSGMRVAPATDAAAAGPVGGPYTPASFEYVIENVDEAAFDFEVTWSAAWLDVSNTSGTLAPGGSATVTVTLNAAANGLPAGDHSDELVFTNLTTHDGDTSRTVSVESGAPQAVYAWYLDSDPGWDKQGQWAFGVPLGLGGGSWGNPDPTGGATGENVYGVNLAGDYSTAVGGPYHLTLGPVNMRHYTDTVLRFQRWLNSDYEPYVTSSVEVSTNGTAWTEVFVNSSTDPTADDAWYPQEIDIADIADGSETLYVRWSYGIGRSGAFAYSGWNIDDVELWARDLAPPVCRGDANCSGAVDWRDIDFFVAAMNDNEAAWEAMFADGPTCPFASCDANADGNVNWRDIDPLVSLMNTTCP